MAYLFPVTITSFSLSFCYSVTSILWSEGHLCLCLWTLWSLQALLGQLYAQIQWLGPGWKSADHLEAKQKALLTHWMWLKDMTFLWVFLLGKEVFGSL